MDQNNPEEIRVNNVDIPVASVAKAVSEKIFVTVNMPKQKRRWLVGALVLCIFIILYLLAAIGTISTMSQGGLAAKVLEEGTDESSQVAVWTISGGIDTETADKFDAFVRQIDDDETVKAVVVRVNSPGGAVSPSDRMNRAIAQLRADGRNVVVSMGDVAASGGYFLSAAADWIVAEPSTITGSIGVISITPVIKGATDMMGIDFVVIRSTRSQRHKAAMNYFESPSVEAIDTYRHMLDNIHDLFVDVVVRGRTNLGREGVEPLADGRVWIGQEAMDNGLVDEIGYMDSAIDKARNLAGCPDASVKSYCERSGFASNLFNAKVQKPFSIDSELLDELTSSRIMLLWRP